ncbi:MAG: carbamoyl-phosphate synthase large subunit [Leptospiraceae bacterium]|nr:carbamoyl-phosphate synthase large subunit [Leptospiraceae bacterium]
MQRLLIANRGEIAIRIAGAALEQGIQPIGIYTPEDAESLHTTVMECLPLLNSSTYLDGAAILEIARDRQIDALHPGYGFLSESASFARQCEEAGIVFVGPSPETLELYGNKWKAIEQARELGVPSLAHRELSSSEDAGQFMEQIGGPILLKANSGGGGRGMRLVRNASDLEGAFLACKREAESSTGISLLYVEEYLEQCRHIEVQTLGDGENIYVVGLRDCSLQRRFQKMIEIAPAPFLSNEIEESLKQYALQMARAANLRSLATYEFLYQPHSNRIVFIECNPRLQVEHTVTEETKNLDLVGLQLLISSGKSIGDLEIENRKSAGFAIQLRINLERIATDGTIHPDSGAIEELTFPGGPGIRQDSHGYVGYRMPSSYDTMLGKLIIRGRDWPSTLRKARDAMKQMRVVPVGNTALLRAMLARPELEEYRVHTSFVDMHLSDLLKSAETLEAPIRRSEAATPGAEASTIASYEEFHDGLEAIRSPMAARLLHLEVSAGDYVRKGQTVAIVSAMKMENQLSSHCHGFVEKIGVNEGQELETNQIMLLIRPVEGGEESEEEVIQDLESIPDSLAKLNHRRQQILDESRPRAVAKRRKRKQRTARENLKDLCDPGSFLEYGDMAIAAQRRRHSEEELIRLSPADGLVAGLGTVNGTLFGEASARCAAMSYDYTVFAGTQGAMNHKKTDRLLQVVARLELPMVTFTEGGGGRPGEIDVPAVAGLDIHTFRQYASLSGVVPRIAIASGRCFAGNAALFGASDITIATQNATIGMGGPVMIKGGGLGNYRAEEVGPAAMQYSNGVVDILVEDEEEAVQVAKKALSYFQGELPASSSDGRMLRHCIPENRRRAYDMHRLISLLIDSESFLELRGGFGRAMITGLARINGMPLGLMANNPNCNAGAIDADAADKASRFMQLCDAHGIPLLSLCDTPGIMVGPDAESTALVRHAARMFLTSASISVPMFTIVVRRGYGLGAMAMAGGSFHSTVFTVAWPTGEFGAMGLEGEVKIGFQKELAEIQDWDAREARYQELLKEAIHRGRATNMAAYLEIDSVIDPADSRTWLIRGLKSLPPNATRTRRPMVDSW